MSNPITKTAQAVGGAIKGVAKAYGSALSSGNQQIAKVNQKIGGVDPTGFVGSAEYAGAKGAKIGYQAGTDLLNMIEEHAPEMGKIVNGAMKSTVNLDAMDYLNSIRTRLIGNQHVSNGEATVAREALQPFIDSAQKKAAAGFTSTPLK